MAPGHRPRRLALHVDAAAGRPGHDPRPGSRRQRQPAIPARKRGRDGRTGDAGHLLDPLAGTAGGAGAPRAGWRADPDRDGLVRLVAAGPEWQPRRWVPLATAVLEAGATRALVGTRALLGEGWDAPCVNCGGASSAASVSSHAAARAASASSSRSSGDPAVNENQIAMPHATSTTARPAVAIQRQMRRRGGGPGDFGPPFVLALGLPLYTHPAEVEKSYKDVSPARANTSATVTIAPIAYAE